MQEHLNQQLLLGTVIVGGGPAGLALLLAARRNGLLADLLRGGLRIIERNSVLGSGEIGNYIIRSDSLAESFLKQIDIEANPPLHQLLKLSAGAQLNAQRGHPIDLPIVADFLTDIAVEFRSMLQACDMDPFVNGMEAIRATRQFDGTWVTNCRRADGSNVDFHSRSLVLATGAHQPVQRLFEEKVAGIPLLPRHANKTVQSGEILGPRGPDKISKVLGDLRSPKVAIVGGSHSAISSAHVCLYRSGKISFEPGSITLLHQNTLRLTYDSPDEALADGYDAFCSSDICPKTGRVFPLAGFRCDSRELLRQCWELGGLERENRLRLLSLEKSRYQEANKVLQEADLIIAALGYRPRALPLFDHANHPLDLFSDRGDSPLVDEHSRVLDVTGCPIPSVFAMGLAAGFPLAGVHGEPSFTGQANGLALWQSDIGEGIVQQLLKMDKHADKASE